MAAAFVVAAVIVVIAAVVPSSARAQHAPESIFQDDDHLIYADSGTVSQTLSTLAALGVDRIRVTIQWNDIAPQPGSTTEPAGFNASDPAAYTDPAYGGSPGVWDPYDRIVEMAEAHGIGVDFNLTAPGPLWAMQPAPANTQFGSRPANHYEPSAVLFGQFAQAVGTRYSGSYVPPAPGSTSTSSKRARVTIPLLPSLTVASDQVGTTVPGALPRVHYWSIWNEPNQPGWLAPQWGSYNGRRVPESPALYRSLVDAGVGGLYTTGHTFSTDTILVGETAPEGSIASVGSGRHVHYLNSTGFYDAMTPMVFLRSLYCVGAHYHQLSGSAAAAVGCPTGGSASSFVNAHPGLFFAAGFAHHPYFFLFKPSYSSPVPDFVPLANIGRLERGLDRIFGTYHISRHIPIYFTEYGYQTNPPDPYQVVSPNQQAAYLNEADYMAWKDPRVRAVSQFLLYDAGPDANYPSSSYNYWDTFQTGLIYGPGTSRNGTPKPAYYAYRLPIWVPQATIKRGSKLFIWGMLRMAPRDTGQTAVIRFKSTRARRFTTIGTVYVSPTSVYGYFTTRVKLPGSGTVRIGWRGPSRTLYVSRGVGVTVR